MTYAVLIVEDNATKRAEIEKALPVPHSQFEVTGTPSIAQAYRALEGKRWNLIILDMTFQVSRDAGSAIFKEALAGVELLQYMARRRISAPVIVATQHSSFSSPGWPAIDEIDSVDKLHDVLSELFPANYRQTVLVDLAGEAWKVCLQEAVVEALNVGT